MGAERSLPTLLVVLAMFVVIGCREAALPPSNPVRAVRAMKIADFEGASRRSFPGRASASQEVDLAFRVAGPLVAFPIKIGDNVNQGDLIAQIDPRDFEVALRNVEGNLLRARANQTRAKDDLARFEGVRERSPGVITEQQIVAAREAVDVAKADIAALEAAVDAAKDAVQDTELRAPFTGTIVATHVENFENVRQKQMIARLLDKSRIEFEVNMPETLISLVPYVQDAHVTFDAFADVKIPAEVKEIGNEASETTRTFPVTLIMDQPQEVKILPGMAGRASGTATPPGKEANIRIVVPVSALFAPEENKSFVWVIDPANNTVKRREVKVGKLASSGYVIEAGLVRGDLIATAGVHFLQEGQQVRPDIQ